MHEPIKVDVPTMFPHACLTCRSATGPLVDTNVETLDRQRVYLCASCVSASARTLGISAGDEQAGLLHAVENATDLQKRLDRLTGQRKKLSESLEKEKALSGQLAEQLEWAEGRNKQLEGLIRSDAEAALAVVSE